jgi:HAE1 family hydrophobic/amphiphilic exporter-1
VAVTVLSIVAGILGAVAVIRMPVDLLPSVEYPRLTVETTYPSSSPYEVERLVTDPLEDALAGVRGLRSYTSRSYGDMSRITLEFDWGTNMDYTRLEVREKLDIASWSLPDDAGRPTMVDYDPSTRPFMEILMTMDGSWTDITDFARRVVTARLEQAEGVASVETSGGADPAVFVRLRPGVMEELGLDPSTVSAALAGANAVMAGGGEVLDGQKEFFLSLQGEFETLEDVESTVIGFLGTSPLLLGEVADVYLDEKPPTEWASYNGERAVILRVRKMSEANTVDVAGEVEGLIDELTQAYPSLGLTVIQNDAGFIRDSIDGVVEALIMGGLLAFGILFFFLRDWKSPLVMGISIPLSISISLFFLYMAGVTVNIMSLGGLALGSGLLVDNAVVVLEAIYRRREQGEARASAAVTGTGEVGQAILASTLTTVVVFFPVVYMEGVTSQLFRDQALAVGSALMASLLVSVTVIPAMAARLGRSGVSTDVTARWKDAYCRLLERLLGRRKTLLTVTGAVTAAAVAGAALLPMQLLPEVPENQLELSFSAGEGTSMERLVELSETASDLALRSGARWTSGRAGVRAEEGVDVLLTAFYGSADEALQAIHPMRSSWNGMFNFPLQVVVREGLLGQILGGGTGFTVFLEGENTEASLNAARELADESVRNIGEITGADVQYLPGNPEIVLTPDQELLGLLGVSIGDLADFIESLSRGISATTYYRQDERVDVVVLGDRGEGIMLDSLLLRAMPTSGGLVQLSRMVDSRVRDTPGFIEHYQGNRAVAVSFSGGGANLAGTSENVRRLSRTVLEGAPVRLRLGPEIEEMDRTVSSLLLAAVLAVALVYVLLAVQFENFLEPFIIMFTVPLGVIGVVLALAVTGESWNALSGIGLVVLSGIVVNDGILLVERISQLRKQGISTREAILGAGRDRFRPVLMTTATTVLGLLPMALGIGTGGALRKPLAVAIIGGIMVATLLTLVVVPVLYSLLREGRR